MSVVSVPIQRVSVGERIVVALSFMQRLDDGETLTGVPTVTEVETTDLTLSGPQVNAVERRRGRRRFAAGTLVIFTAEGFIAATGESRYADWHYEVAVTVPTSRGQTLVGRVRINVLEF